MISVCMPYFNNSAMKGNRQEMLYRSLEGYERCYDYLEISICDDGSPVPVDASSTGPHRTIISRLPEKDYALNPCVPMNVAVEASTGDVIVITNPEMEHKEPILDKMLERLDPGDYVTASCINPDGRWLAHSSIKPEGTKLRAPIPPGSQFHFCAMMDRELWEKAEGFDEDYREGQAFDDNDWLWRLESVGANFKHFDDLVVHHHPTGTKWPEGGWQRNANLLMEKWRDRWLEVFP